jgi:glucose/arabinose dehydrogenase
MTPHRVLSDGADGSNLRVRCNHLPEGGHMKRVLTVAVAALALAGCDGDDGRRSVTDPQTPTGGDIALGNLVPSAAFPTILLPQGLKIEKVVEGLTFPTALTFDSAGRMYVAEAGGGFLEEPPPARILRVEPGRVTEVVNLEGKVRASVVGLTFHNGSFFISHRDPRDRTGAVSRVSMDGQVTQILTGIQDSKSEHQVNDIKVGPNGQMFLATGPAGNSAVVGLDLAPFIGLSPDLRTTPCQDIVLTGVNYLTPDFRTKEDESDVVQTGAFVPFGTITRQGQRIQGTKKCGGSILVFDPNNAEATVRPFVSGLRNAIGIAFNRTTGEMFFTQNGYDVRGSRPFNDRFDPTYRVRENTWYGYPDFSAAFEPATDPKFDVPNSLQAKKFRNGQPLPLNQLHFLIDHQASNLRPPTDQSLIVGLHEINSSPSGVDIAPASFAGNVAGQLFIAEWGDLAPLTTPLRNDPTGSRIVRVDPRGGNKTPDVFIRNAKPGPASEQGAMGMGLERPYYVAFGPDGAMYIVDYGIVRPNRPDADPGDDPYEFAPRTGIIWKVSRATQ